MRLHSLRTSWWRIHSLGRRESVLCTDRIPEIMHLVNLSQRSHWSKGVRETRQEDRVIGNLAAAGHLEESASHHILKQHAIIALGLVIWSAVTKS